MAPIVTNSALFSSIHIPSNVKHPFLTRVFNNNVKKKEKKKRNNNNKKRAKKLSKWQSIKMSVYRHLYHNHHFDFRLQDYLHGKDSIR